MLNTLEATIQKLIADAAHAMATQIASAVRQSIAAEIVGSGSAGSHTVSAPSAEPKRRGRPPGPKAKAPAPAAIAAPKAATPAPAAPAKGKRKSFKRHPITQGELDIILAVIAKKPGLGSSAIQKAAGVDKKQAVRVLAKLRLNKSVKVTGEKSKATYSVA